MLTKQETIGKGRPGGEQQGKGTQENCSATGLAALGFIVMGLVSEFSLASHLAWPMPGDSGSFLVAHPSLSQDGFQREGFWEVGRLLLLWAPPEFSWLVLRGSTAFLMGASCGETTQVSRLSSCLAKAGGFGQGFPNAITSIF